MNPRRKKRDQFPYIAFLAFLALTLGFSYFRNGIGRFNSWLLHNLGTSIAIGKEVKKKGTPDDLAGNQTKKGQPSKKKSQPKKRQNKNTKKVKRPAPIDHSKPVLSKLPKTVQPKVTFNPGLSACPEEVSAAKLPPLRNYDGKPWNKENTDISIATNGKRLFITCICHDKNPEKLITKYSKQSEDSAFQDDSVEFFLMKDKKAPIYCQYVCSASGVSNTDYFKREWKQAPYELVPAEKPADFVPPEIKAEKLDKGYKVLMSIDLSNIGIKELKPNEQFLIQFIRNYRGQALKGSVLLQLFPNFIYCDNRLSFHNHDRRAFQPAKVVKGKF